MGTGRASATQRTQTHDHQVGRQAEDENDIEIRVDIEIPVDIEIRVDDEDKTDDDIPVEVDDDRKTYTSTSPRRT